MTPNPRVSVIFDYAYLVDWERVIWWTWSGSNRRPLPCHGSALPNCATGPHAAGRQLHYCLCWGQIRQSAVNRCGAHPSSASPKLSASQCRSPDSPTSQSDRCDGWSARRDHYHQCVRRAMRADTVNSFIVQISFQLDEIPVLTINI